MAGLRKLNKMIERIAFEGLDIDENEQITDSELIEFVGVQDADVIEILNELKMKRDEKVIHIAYALRSQASKIAEIDAEIKSLNAWKARLKKRGAQMEQWCISEMIAAGIKKVVGKFLTVSIRKNPVSAKYAKDGRKPIISEIDPTYIYQVVEDKVDSKAAIKDFKQHGKPIKGFEFVTDKHHIRTSR